MNPTFGPGRRSLARRVKDSRVAGEVRATLREPLLVVWSLFLLCSPIFVFSSGLPQPSDYLMLLLLPMALRVWNGRLPASQKHITLALFVFIAYVVAAAIVWSIVEGTVAISLKDGFVLSPLFWLFNTSAFLISLVLYRHYGDRFIALTVQVTLLAMVLQVPFVAMSGRSDGARSAGLVNNPNQLGYYAALSIAIVLLGQKRAKLAPTWAMIGLVCGTFLAIASASKAALAAVALIIVIATMSRLRTIIMAALVAAVLVAAVEPIGHYVERAAERFSAGEERSFVEERGYDRIIQHPEYWLLGAGEGGYRRFAETTAIGAHELHSSAGTLFFCYGIAGTVLFFVFLFRVGRGAGYRQILMAVAVASYGPSHHGLRVTLLWVFLALMVVATTRTPRTRT